MMEYPIKVMLVDDQSLVAYAIEKILKNDPKIQFHYCSNPTKAIQEALLFKPTVILQDLVMPDIDGLTLVKYLKNHEFIKNIPLIVLSSKEEPQMKAACFSAGANDYLVKIPDEIELLARIRYHSNSYIRLLERNDAYTKLKESQDQLKSDIEEAGSYVKSLLPSPIKSDKLSADWLYIPSKALGGDVFGYDWINPNQFVFYILDVCGHGVGAALFSMSILNALRSKTLKRDEPHVVLNTLNEMFPMEEHQDMFFTIFYGVIDLQQKKLSYSSAGHPPQLLIHNQSSQLIKSDCIAIGVEKSFRYKTHEISLKSPSKLFLFSDGAFEIRGKDKKMLEFNDFISLLSKHPSLPSIMEQVIALEGPLPFEDDFSFIEITF